MPKPTKHYKPDALCADSVLHIGNATLITIGHRLDSITNGSFGNRFAHTARVTKQKELVAIWLMKARVASHHVPPLDIRLVRIGVGHMDGDNLQPAFKYVRDTIAKYLGVDDGDRAMKTFRPDARGMTPLEFDYDQEKHTAYGIRIEIRPRAS